MRRPVQPSGTSKNLGRDRGAEPALVITFGSFTFDARAGRLLRGSEPIPLRPKTWSVLYYLLQHSDVLVTKNELLEAVWPNLAVTETVVNRSIGELRVALGDSVKTPRFIETVPRRGFRFVAPVGRGEPPTGIVPYEISSQGPSPAPALSIHHESSPTPFVGRTTELQRLATLLARAQGGERQVVFVTGPAGIGKTALVAAFLDSASLGQVAGPVWVGRGLCLEQYGPREPYMPVLEVLERLARRPDADRLPGLLRRLAPTWLAQMPGLIADDELQMLRQSLRPVTPGRMPREFAKFVEVLTTDVTLVLVLEDLHWIDPSSLDILSLLAERYEPARLLVIATYRPAEAIVRGHPVAHSVRALQAHRRCKELPLQDLPEEEVRSYLRTRFPGNDFPRTLAHLIHRHTDGNPLFMVAAVDHMRSRGYILNTSPGWTLSAAAEKIDLSVPDDVRLMIQSQHHALSPADRAVLEAASVAGSEFTALVVATALDGEVVDVEMRCEAFVESLRFLRIVGTVDWPDGSVSRRYGFLHELYRQVVYSDIPDGRRVRLHQRIGQALEAAYGARQREIAPQLATHFRLGREDARALHYLTAAAAGARWRFADRETIGYLEAALPLIARLPGEEERRRGELDVRLALGAALGNVRGFASESVRENYTRASELCRAVGSAEALFEILYARWYLHAMRADRKEATAIADELEALARRLKPPEYRMLSDSVAVRTALYDGRFVEANRRMQRLQTPRPRAKRVAAGASYGVDPLIAASSHAAIALWFLGHPERAQTGARAALARARESGHLFTISAVLMQAALVELLCRNPKDGADLAEQAANVATDNGFAFWNALASLLMGWALVQQGRGPEGQGALERSHSAMKATGTRFFSAFAYAFLAENHLRNGALGDGLAAAEAGLEVTRTTLDRAYAPELWRLKGELLEAQARVEGSVPKARRARVGGSRPHAAEQALACFQRALGLTRAAQAKSLELRAATSLARARHVRGRTADARRLLGDVVEWFGTRATSPDLVEARVLLEGLDKS